MNTLEAQYTEPSTLNRKPAWRSSDTIWMLGLYGTAIGAGVLFLPINAGSGGIFPLIIMVLLAFPITYYAHRGLTRLVLSSGQSNANITAVIAEHFGEKAGVIFTYLYFFTIYPILLVYSVAITNTVDSFIVHQLQITSPPRWLLSLCLVSSLMAIIYCGEALIVKVMSLLVYPLIAVLLLISFFLIPYWDISSFTLPSLDDLPTPSNTLITLWLAIPMLVFAFNHSAIISSFAVAKREEYNDSEVDNKCSQILTRAHLLMVITVMFFVLSCTLALSPANLEEAKHQNLSIISYLANHFDTPMLAVVAPLFAFIAIAKSFLGHYLGARDGLNGIIVSAVPSPVRQLPTAILNRLSSLLILLTTWAIAYINPSILTMIQVFGGPMFTLLLFFLPVYACYTAPKLKEFKNKLSNKFILIVGFSSLTATIYSIIPGN